MEKYRVESIALRKVGVFDDVRLDFPPIASAERDEEKAEIHLFTGPNGCGKSTLLYALAALFTPPWLSGLVEKRYRNSESRVDFCFAGQSGMYGLKAPTEMRNEFGNFELILNDVANSKFFGCQIQTYNAELEKTLRTYKETMASFNSQNRNNVIRFPFAAFAYSGQRSVIQNASVNAIQEITVSPFDNAVSFDATVRPQLLLQWIANNRTKAALAQVEGEQSDARQYDRALERIVTVIRDICEWDIDFKLERDPLGVTIQVNGDLLSFDVLPDGLKSIIGWVSDLSLRLEAIPWVNRERDIFAQPILLLLDEIDIHLHPHWQRRVLPAIQKLLPNAQIFASTHSPFVVGSVKDAWVYQLPEKGKQTERLIPAAASDPGKSYQAVLEEVFGVDKEFGEEIEKLFVQFYQAKQAYLQERTGDRLEQLRHIVREFADKGEEPMAIITREIRQIARLTGEEAFPL